MYHLGLVTPLEHSFYKSNPAPQMNIVHPTFDYPEELFRFESVEAQGMRSGWRIWGTDRKARLPHLRCGRSLPQYWWSHTNK